jgi:hypothetical protein
MTDSHSDHSDADMTYAPPDVDPEYEQEQAQVQEQERMEKDKETSTADHTADSSTDPAAATHGKGDSDGGGQAQAGQADTAKDASQPAPAGSDAEAPQVPEKIIAAGKEKARAKYLEEKRKRKAEQDAKWKKQDDLSFALMEHAGQLQKNIEQIQTNIGIETHKLLERCGENLSEIFGNIRKASDEISTSSSLCKSVCGELNVKIRKQYIFYTAFFICIITMIFIGFNVAKWSISNLQSEREELKIEVDKFKAQAEEFAVKAGKASLNKCDGRLCIRVDGSRTYKGDDNNNAVYMIIYGY